MKYFVLLTLSLIISSCSNIKWSSFFSDDDDNLKRSEKLMKSFEVEEDVMSKFEAKKEVEQTAPKKEEDTKVKEPEEKVAKKEVSKKETKKVVKKVVSAPRKEIKPKPNPKLIPIKSKYPADYPANLKELSQAAKKNWKDFKPVWFEGERVYMDINYMGVSTGRIVISTLDPIFIGERKAYHFNAKVKTASYYRYLYELDDTVDSYFSVENNLPLKFSLIQRESDKDVDDLQLFDLDELKTYSFYKKVTSKKTKKKKNTKYIPTHYVDPLSIIYFLRSLPMDKGSEYSIPIMNQGKIIMINTRVMGTAKIDTKIGEKEAYIVKANTKYSGDTLKSGDMTFWFSADEKRIFLKFEAEIKIGSITGDIEKYEL